VDQETYYRSLIENDKSPGAVPEIPAKEQNATEQNSNEQSAKEKKSVELKKKEEPIDGIVLLSSEGGHVVVKSGTKERLIERLFDPNIHGNSI
jgi:hypothetical protein